MDDWESDYEEEEEEEEEPEDGINGSFLLDQLLQMHQSLDVERLRAGWIESMEEIDDLMLPFQTAMLRCRPGGDRCFLDLVNLFPICSRTHNFTGDFHEQWGYGQPEVYRTRQWKYAAVKAFLGAGFPWGNSRKVVRAVGKFKAMMSGEEAAGGPRAGGRDAHLASEREEEDVVDLLYWDIQNVAEGFHMYFRMKLKDVFHYEWQMAGGNRFPLAGLKAIKYILWRMIGRSNISEEGSSSLRIQLLSLASKDIVNEDHFLRVINRMKLLLTQLKRLDPAASVAMHEQKLSSELRLRCIQSPCKGLNLFEEVLSPNCSMEEILAVALYLEHAQALPNLLQSCSSLSPVYHPPPQNGQGGRQNFQGGAAGGQSQSFQPGGMLPDGRDDPLSHQNSPGAQRRFTPAWRSGSGRQHNQPYAHSTSDGQPGSSRSLPLEMLVKSSQDKMRTIMDQLQRLRGSRVQAQTSEVVAPFPRTPVVRPSGGQESQGAIGGVMLPRADVTFGVDSDLTFEKMNQLKQELENELEDGTGETQFFLADLRSNFSMVGYAGLLTDVEFADKPLTVQTAAGMIRCDKFGTLTINLTREGDNCGCLELKEVWVCERLELPMVSVESLVKDQLHVRWFGANRSRLLCMCTEDGRVKIALNPRNAAYLLRAKVGRDNWLELEVMPRTTQSMEPAQSAHSSQSMQLTVYDSPNSWRGPDGEGEGTDSDTYLWHCRLGHVDSSVQARLARSVSCVVFDPSDALVPCNTCELVPSESGPSQVSALPQQEASRPNECWALELEEQDGSWGRWSCRFLLTVVDVFSGYVQVRTMGALRETAGVLSKMLESQARGQRGPVRRLIYDRSNELLYRELTYLPHRHNVTWQAVGVERMERSGAWEAWEALKVMSERMMQESQVPGDMWVYSWMYASLLHNILPRPQDDQTPHLLYHRTMFQDHNELMVFGCAVVNEGPSSSSHSYSCSYTTGVFLGLELDELGRFNNYIVLDLETDEIQWMTEATFDEWIYPMMSDESMSDAPSNYEQDYSTEADDGGLDSDWGGRQRKRRYDEISGWYPEPYDGGNYTYGGHRGWYGWQ